MSGILSPPEAANFTDEPRDPEFAAEAANIPDDPEFVADIVRLEEEEGPLPERVVEARRALWRRARLCEAGNHVYTLTGRILDLPGGSPHWEVACAFSGLHPPETQHYRLIGPLVIPGEVGIRYLSPEQLREHRAGLPVDQDRI